MVARWSYYGVHQFDCYDRHAATPSRSGAPKSCDVESKCAHLCNFHDDVDDEDEDVDATAYGRRLDDGDDDEMVVVMKAVRLNMETWKR